MILRRQRLSFPWLFLSQHGLYALSNPCITSWSSFHDDFWVGSDSAFVDYFRVKKGCVHWWVYVSALELVSVMNSESAATRFSLTISNSTRAMCADESMCHLWKQFRWQFLSWQRLTLPWLFVSQHGLCAMTNPCVNSRTSFGDDFLVGSDIVFLECFWVNGG